ncbi:hypothetical protein RM780_07485 [Streptomyces sp. DSM 44917]|uniref:DUF4235 domain-containing protein n=1 Tax=Streptomyces boetiae TaxID=3075541 RepID=A0ABU2L5I0_9ACTN|nr:hypothetical protein [Streptomyces sp. DSM 44917]MDT0306804.1 hypothetical protein [Streptomyces sp. DSM 44917]
MSKKPKSKASTYLSLGSTLFGAFGTVRRLKEARVEGDRLRFADALVSAAAVVTGIALLARDLRRMNSESAAVPAGDGK